MSERLQKYLAGRGAASRRRAEELIAAGRVTVNGQVARIGQQVEDEDEVAVDGILVAGAEERVYLMLHKPAGVVTTTTRRHSEHTILDLLPVEPRVLPAGRLDKDSTGLLLLSNDGEWSNLVTHPSYGVEKEYEVLLQGHPQAAALDRMRAGVEIAPGTVTAPAGVDFRAATPAGTRLSVTVMVGKKRQIRLMAAAVGHPVLALRRVRIGAIRLENLPEGRWRALREEEVESIREHARRSAPGGPPSPTEDRHRRPRRRW